MPEWINYTSTQLQHTLEPIASSCSLGKLENEYVQEGWDKELPLERLHFPLSPRFTERFWHLSKYFFALADRPIDYFNTFCTCDTAPYKIYAKYNPFYSQFGLYSVCTDGSKQHQPQSKSSEDACFTRCKTTYLCNITFNTLIPLST